MSCQPIGLFDSGVGGLSVLRELRRQLPSENTVYFADTLHMPYGPRSPEELQEIVYAILKFLQERNVKLVIMACNTSSAVVLPSARLEFVLPMLGMIDPVVKRLASSSVQRLGVMATEATVRSGTYGRELSSAGFQGVVYCQPCAELAALVESGDSTEHLDSVLQTYASPLRQAQVEQVVLGCTHYPFASQSISAALGSEIPLLDPATYVVEEAKGYLEREDMLCGLDAPGQTIAYVSGSLSSFEHRASQLLDRPPTAWPVRYLAEQATYNLPR